ncbi:MAG: restriction endonuclease subunit S [Eubacteriales bacterium]
MNSEKWEMVKLGDVCTKGGSNIAQKDLGNRNGEYPIYGAGGLIKSVDFHKQSKAYIAIVKDGAGIGRTMILPEKSSVIGTMQYIFPNDNIDIRYLYYAILKMNLSKYFSGATIPHIYFKDYRNENVWLPPIKVQKQIADELDKITGLIEKRKEQLEKLDVLVKSRFIEMFGDPVVNPYGYPKVALSELADIKIGPFGSLLHKDEYIKDGYPLINPSHIIDDKICPDSNLTISFSKYQELVSYHLKKNDVILGRRGEMGRCAVVNEDNLLCGTGSILIRSKGSVTADYIQKIISFPTFKNSIEDLAVGQTMPNLNVPIVSNFQMILVPIDIQEQYYSFVEQVDKSKFEIKQSLEKLETLKKALMQEYFG